MTMPIIRPARRIGALYVPPTGRCCCGGTVMLTYPTNTCRCGRGWNQSGNPVTPLIVMLRREPLPKWARYFLTWVGQ